MKVTYTDKDTSQTAVIAEIMTNHSVTIWEALEIAGVDMDQYADVCGWDGWDPEALEVAA